KLKDGKKDFFFGDLELLYGNQKFYNLNPSLFKYSKDYKYALIGSSNNIGAPLSNILALQETVLNDNFSSSTLLDELRHKNKEVLNTLENAAGVAFDGLITEKKKLSVNIIGHDANRNYLIRSSNTYLNNPLLTEERELSRNKKFRNYFAGLGYENQLSNQGLFKLNSEIFKAGSSDSRFLNSNYNSENINVEVGDKQESNGLNTHFTLVQKINSKVTYNSQLYFVLRRDIRDLQIIGNDEFLEQFFIKDQESGTYNQYSSADLGEVSFNNDLYYTFNPQNFLKLTGILSSHLLKRTLRNPFITSTSHISDESDGSSDFQIEGL